MQIWPELNLGRQMTEVTESKLIQDSFSEQNSDLEQEIGPGDLWAEGFLVVNTVPSATFLSLAHPAQARLCFPACEMGEPLLTIVGL